MRVRLHGSYSSNTAPANGVYFEHRPEANPLWYIIRMSGGASTGVSIAAKPMAAGQWVKLRCVITGGTSAQFFIRSTTTTTGTFDGAGTITSNIPAGPQISTNLKMDHDAGSSTALRASFDYLFQRYTVAR